MKSILYPPVEVEWIEGKESREILSITATTVHGTTVPTNRRIDSNHETAAAVAFTTQSDETRHRLRVRHCDEQPGLELVHEVTEDSGWQVVSCEPVTQLRVGAAEPQPDHDAYQLVQ